MTREAALNTTRVTYHEMQPGSPSVIFMDEHSLSSPLGAPPSYSSPEFERQIDEPPSYDEAGRISATPAVIFKISNKANRVWRPSRHPPECVVA